MRVNCFATATHSAHIYLSCRTADEEVLKEMLYADDADRALRDGSLGCLSGTRTEITDAARDWATGVIPQSKQPQYLGAFNSKSSVLWLCGVIGAGKSSIAISLALVLREMGLLGSMYSFQATNQAHLNPTNLFSTIARHLSQHSQLLKKRLHKILIKSHHTIRATASPKEQFENFILLLLAERDVQIATQPIVIIIDAFDACGNIGTRREILEILTRRAHELPSYFRILITSRYEPDVLDALTSPLKNVGVMMMEHVPKESTEHDINAYVRDALGGVRGMTMERSVSQLTMLASAAEESFQWASTACLFIRNEDDGNDMLDPEGRLLQVVRSSEGLDSLYRTVLDRHFGTSTSKMLEPLLALLGCLACAREPLCLHAIVSLSTTESTLPNEDLDTFHQIARKLSSLIIGTQDLETPLVVLHSSFLYFLVDENRSQKYFVDPLKFHKTLASNSLGVMKRSLRFNICDLPTSLKPNAEIENIHKLVREHIPDALSYACRSWAYHLSQVDTWIESDGLRESVTALLRNYVLEWLEVMSLTETSPTHSLGYIANVYQVRNYCLAPLLVLMMHSRFHPNTPIFRNSFVKHRDL